MAGELWQELLLRLEFEQICLDDLPTTEEPLWGILKELGFTSYLDRVKLCKEITAGKQKVASCVSSSKTSTLVGTTNPVSSQFIGLLSDSGQRGLAVACRSAHTMALATCQTTQDAELWLQMPHTVASIGANIQAYEVMQETRRKHPLRGCSAQGASIALRDTLTLLIANAYPAFDDVFDDIASLIKVPVHAMPLLRSQIHLSRTSMARLAQRRTDIEEEVVKIYTVPLSGDEIADIHAAYFDCAQRTASAPKRKAIRPSKNNKKKTEISGPSSPIEIVFHGQQPEVQEAANIWSQQICHESLAVWSTQWEDYTWSGNYTYDCERAGVQPRSN